VNICLRFIAPFQFFAFTFAPQAKLGYILGIDI